MTQNTTNMDVCRYKVGTLLMRVSKDGVGLADKPIYVVAGIHKRVYITVDTSNGNKTFLPDRYIGPRNNWNYSFWLLKEV